jgi:hypothetical protein
MRKRTRRRKRTSGYIEQINTKMAASSNNTTIV